MNQVEIENLQGEATALNDGDEVAVIPALAGGAPTTLTPEMVERYSRHLIMPQVGSAGQRKIIESKVLIIGAGGLGSPVALYLALAGVGTIGIVDFDVVDRSNLQRQILHQTDDIGKPKVESAQARRCSRTTRTSTSITHEEPITSDNAFEIIEQYDIVVNGADNFATRYLVNDACYLLKKPLVDGSILMFDGQATTYLPGQGLLPLPLPGAAAAGHGPELRRSRRARRDVRHDRQHPGDRSAQAHPRRRRTAGEPAAPLRRTLARVPHREGAARPGVPALRRQPDHHAN